MRLKRYSDFEKIEEGIFKNILLSTLLSLGVITSSDAGNIDKDDKDKIEKVEEDRPVAEFIKFMKKKDITLNRKYSLKDIMMDFKRDTTYNFEDVLPKLNQRYSPISASVFTFSSKEAGLTRIPMATLDVNITDDLKISFWDSGWFPGSNMIGGGISYKFGK